MANYLSNEEQKRWREETKGRLVEYKGGKCLDCNGTFPICCYDFHHRDYASKEFEISGPRLLLPFVDLCEEADKCDLLCSNCHRIRQSNDPTHREHMSNAAKRRWERTKRETPTNGIIWRK